MAARNLVNKVRYNNGILEDLCFNKDNISLGISSDYKISDSADNLPDAYAESCFTGWYQSVNTGISSTANTKSNYVLLSNKPPGGSIFLQKRQSGVRIRETGQNGIPFLNCNDFTLEFWVKFAGFSYTPFTLPNLTPIITNTISTFVSGYIIGIYTDGNGISNLALYLGSDQSTVLNPWDIFNDALTDSFISADTWYHVCLSRKEYDIKFAVNGVWTKSVNTALCIDNLSGVTSDNEVYIGTYSNTYNVGMTDKCDFYITNLRYLIGVAKYDLNAENFTPPSYPISAIGNSAHTFNVPILLNTFQSSKAFFNSGISRNIAINSKDTTWQNNTPFLYDIPRIYKWGQTANANDFISNMNNFAKNIDGSGPFTTFQEVTNWYRGKNNVFINNFEYENIPTSGLTYYYDPEHIMSFPGAVDFTGHTGSSVYNLINNSTSVLDIKDPNNFRTDELYTSTNNHFDINNLTINSAFTAVVVFRKQNSSFDFGGSLIVGITGNTSQNISNGFIINTQNNTTNQLNFSIYNSGTTQSQILTRYSAYTLTNYNMFTLSSNGVNNHKVYKNGTNIITDTSTIIRTSGSRNVYFGLKSGTNDVEELNYKLFCLYNRQLTEDEIDRLYKRLKNRMEISI